MDALVQLAPWIAALTGVTGLVLVVTAAVHARRSWRRVRVTQLAAEALLAAHQQPLDEAAARLDQVTVAVDGQRTRLAAAVADLQADVAHLRWLVQQVPDARRAVLDALSAASLLRWARGVAARGSSADAQERPHDGGEHDA